MSMEPDDQGMTRPGAGEPAASPVPDAGVSPEPRLSRKGAWLAMGAVLVALALVWAAPGIDDAQGSGEAAFVGMPAPMHFTVKDMNGVDVKLDSFAGKVVVVNFWATWCGPCELEIPWLVDLQSTYPDDVVVLGVSIDDTADQLKPFAAKLMMNYPVLVAVDRQDVQDAFGPLYGVPVSVFIDRDGRIARRHSGILEKAQLEREIKALL